MFSSLCPLCLRPVEPDGHLTIQLYGKGTEYKTCKSCHEIVEMLRGGSPDDSIVIPVRVSPFHQSILKNFAPFWGNTDADIIKALAFRWIETNIGSHGVIALCELNKKVMNTDERV